MASQSPIHLGPFYDASNAVDRNTSTCMRTDQIGPTAKHKIMWWKIDLGGMYNIYSINILFKNYDGYGKTFLNCLNNSCIVGFSLLL